MKTLALLSFALVTSTAAFAAKTGWDDDYEKALAKAKAEKKMVLVDFTGSDWCEWCMRLDKEVFSKKEFKDYAKENLVLMEADFPMQKQLPRKVKEQNDKLQAAFGIQGFPTVIVLNPNGKKVGEIGYEEGGAAPFVSKLERLKGK